MKVKFVCDINVVLIRAETLENSLKFKANTEKYIEKYFRVFDRIREVK